MATIRPEFHSSLVSQILDDIIYRRSSYYYFLGKIAPWGNEDVPPDTPLNTNYDDVTIRDNILYLKRLEANDASLVTKSYVWTSGTTYYQWDDRVELKNLPFYVVTDEYNVYKCLSNNNNSSSTVKPTTKSLFPFKTSDGYLWKYMYNVPTFKRNKFLSRGYLPVQRALTDTFYNKGAVEQVVVSNGGSGYTDAQLTDITVTGTTSGSGATADITSVGTLGEIIAEGLSVTLGGTGYTAGAAATINSSTGVGAEIKPVCSGGAVTGFTVISAGSGYSASDTISITVGGAELMPIVSRTTGSIIEVKIINPGAGYTSAPTLGVTQSPSTGTGLYGNSYAVLKAILNNGSIANVTIEDPGQNYPADTSTTIVISGDGADAEFTPVVYNGEIVDIIVDNPGSDYSYMNLSIVGTGAGAEAVAILATSDFLSDQSQVEQVAVRGAIYACVVSNGGDNYSSEATLTITGDGTGAEGYPVIINNSISHIVMTSYGSGYTYATLTIDDPNRPTPNNFIDAEMYAILPPVMGHGYDAVKELYADTLCIFSLIKGDQELNLIAQDYRQYGIIQNPVDLLTNKRITSNTSFVSFKVTLSDVMTMNVDDILICNNTKYRVVDISGNTIEIQQLNPFYSIPSGIFVDETDVSVQYTIQKIDSTPQVNKYSGNLLYVTNNTPFTPTSEQTIAIRTYVKI